MTAIPPAEAAAGISPISPAAFLRTVLPAPTAGEHIKVIALRPSGPPHEQFVCTVDAALAFADQHKATADIYFGVTLKQGPRGSAAYTSRFQVLWSDVDEKCFRGGAAQALAALERLPLPPSIVVHSGHGFHAYWLLRAPVGATDGPRARAIMRGLYRVLSTAEGAVSIVDDVSDLARILRLPGTFNRKSTPPKPVTVVVWRPERRYDLADFAGCAALGFGGSGAVTTTAVTTTGADDHRRRENENGHIPEHYRNTTLTRIGGWLRAKGLSLAAIEAALLSINATACMPPLPDAEVRRIAQGMGRYLPEPELRLVRPSAPAGAGVPSSTSLPTINRGVGSEVAGSALLEASGDVLAAAGADADDGTGASLPSLPLLGQEGYIIRGWSHLLAGYPRCGKTELLVACAVDWCRAGHSVLYFTEEPKSIWTVRMARVAAAMSESAEEEERAALARLTVAFALGSDPEALMTRAFRGHEAVLVLDTLRNLLPLRDETDNSEIARALNPWIAAARAAGKTLIVAHHIRKGGGEHGEGIAGGHALLGAFDMALELVRDPQHPDRRLLRAYARLIAPPELVYERAAHGGFQALGEPEALRRAEVMARVRAALTDEWQSTNEVLEALDEPRPGKELLRGVLLELAHRGEVERDPSIEAGRAQGKTVRWRLRVPLRPDPGPGPVPSRFVTSLPTELSIAGSEVAERAAEAVPELGGPAEPEAEGGAGEGAAANVLTLAAAAGYPRYVAGGVRVVQGAEGWRVFWETATPEAQAAAAAWLTGRLGQRDTNTKQEGGGG